MLLEPTLWPLTSPLLWQPLAIAGSLLVVTTLIIGRHAQKKQKVLLFIAGLLTMYALSVFIDWRSTALFDTQFYAGLLVTLLLFAIGAHIIIKQLPDREEKHTSLTRANKSLTLLYSAQHPRYSYVLAGGIIGLLEPVQYSARTYTALVLFRGSHNIGLTAEVLTHILLSLLVSLVVFALGYIAARHGITHYRQSDNQPLLLMTAGTGLMLAAVVLVAIIAFAVRL